MKVGSIFRIVIPDAKKSMINFLNGEQFSLFERRKNLFTKANYGNKNYVPMTDFEAMRGCFVSISAQPLLHQHYDNTALAHQNAWDFESMQADLMRSGFKKDNIVISSYDEKSPDFEFENILDTEARQFERSLYLEAIK